MSQGKIRNAVVEAVSAARDAGVPEDLIRADVEAALSLWAEPPVYAVWTKDDFTGEDFTLAPKFADPEEARTYVQVTWDEMRRDGEPGNFSPEISWNADGLTGQGWFRAGPTVNPWRFIAHYEIRRIG